MEVIERESITICGYSVETTAAQNDEYIFVLYDDFFNSGKKSGLLNLHGCKQGYYGLLWYTKKHEKYCYLLGMDCSPGTARTRLP